ncbi:MAG: hypothetical protein ACK5A1_21010, partial [Planctomyces sp.]
MKRGLVCPELAQGLRATSRTSPLISMGPGEAEARKCDRAAGYHRQRCRTEAVGDWQRGGR